MTSQNYVSNRKKLASNLKDANYLLIGGNALLSKSTDVNYTFRQDSNMLYLTGLNEPSASLLINIKKAKSYVVIPNKSKIQEYFDGAISIDNILKISGCDDVLSYKEVKATLKNQKVYFNLPPKNQNWGVFANPFRAWLKNYLKGAGVQFIDIRPEAAKLRMVKQAYEIEQISKAVDITKKTLQKLEPMIWHSQLTEQDLANKITLSFISLNSNHRYPPIVASGLNAATIHHEPSQTRISRQDMVLIDVGAESNGYCADISRTYTNTIDPLYQDLLKIHNNLIAHVKPGVLLKDIHFESVKLLEDLTKKYNLKEPISDLYPHAIGHHLGLDVHDVADYKQRLQENMIITIEPGLYSKKQGFGYRVEDDILVTKRGSKVL